MVTAGTQTYRARYTKLRQINNVTWLGRKINRMFKRFSACSLRKILPFPATNHTANNNDDPPQPNTSTVVSFVCVQ